MTIMRPVPNNEQGEDTEFMSLRAVGEAILCASLFDCRGTSCLAMMVMGPAPRNDVTRSVPNNDDNETRASQ